MELTSTVLSKVGEPVVAPDRYDDLLLANAEAESLLETNGEKRRIAGGPVGEKLNALVADVRRRLVASRRTEEFETIDAAGHKRWFRASVDNMPRPQLARPTEEVGAVVVLRDVTARTKFDNNMPSSSRPPAMK